MRCLTKIKGVVAFSNATTPFAKSHLRCGEILAFGEG